MIDWLTAALEGRYVVERELGHGGMATVYLAQDIRHGRAVAIKVLRPELAQAVGGDRFLREINIAATLQHPHILPLLESGEADGLLFYVMPFVDGESLRDQLVRDGALPPSVAMRLLRDVVDALTYAHRHGVVHRDIKPDNVMIADRHALVVDFGVAKAMRDATSGHALTSVGISLGTPAYMAPEQAAADPATDHRADIYSLGVLAYEMLCGKVPFAGSPQAVLAAQIMNAPPPLSSVAAAVPPAVEQIVMRCLEKEPADRFQTADELLAALESLITPSGRTSAPAQSTGSVWKGRALVTGGLVALAIIGFGGWRYISRDRWVHRTALPELRRLVDATEYDSAFSLALEIEKAAPGDSTLLGLRPRFARPAQIETQPEGVNVHRAGFPDTSKWRFLGRTPMDSVVLPMRIGLFRYEKAGFVTRYRLSGSLSTLTHLDPDTSAHRGTVLIPGGRFRPFLVGTDAAEPVELGDFRMDEYEITNRQYREFVDAGAYRDRAYWEHPFQLEGRTISWDQAMARFTDRTGRPGPSTWEGGGYPGGADDLPVSGVSWYEAAAYAKFAGKSLPTLYHWARAANIGNARFVVPSSNLEGTGPLAVGKPRGVSAAGVSDMAGNVREWCINEAGQGLRFILGGGWSDPTYGFVDAYAQLPTDRSSINGIRLVSYLSETNLARASQPIRRAFTDFDKERPVSDAVYTGFRPIFDYDPLPLADSIELRDTTSSDWIVERVSFTAAYGRERMTAWLYLPRNAKPPFQSVVFFPGSGAINGGSSASVVDARVSWVVRSGRVLVLPIYKSTYERADSLRSDIPDQSIFWRDHVVMWVKDYRRTLDYLSSRADIDSTKFAYMGLSWGGYMGGIIPAIEQRPKASVLVVAGLTMERGRPEVEPFNHLPRVKVPTLMLNGRHDYFFPLETSQQPFFRVLGPPAEHKKYLLYEGGHDVPRTELIARSLEWFDKYLGPVQERR